MDEQALLRIQIQSYEFYAGLIERAVGGGSGATMPRWDEQRALEYRDLAEQLRRRLAELEAQQADSHEAATSEQKASVASPSESVPARAHP
ncbi:MAG TPA: hypothetical protein VGN32_21305 [Ktedonobacterales bacterium]|nr:hypothetical protein [Ktedonobacterales bacterium]